MLGVVPEIAVGSVLHDVRPVVRHPRVLADTARLLRVPFGGWPRPVYRARRAESDTTSLSLTYICVLCSEVTCAL